MSACTRQADSKDARRIGIMAVVLIGSVVAATYLLAYYLDVERNLWDIAYEGPDPVWISPGYKVGGDLAATIFRPAYYLDRLVRPAVWRWPKAPIQPGRTVVSP